MVAARYHVILPRIDDDKKEAARAEIAELFAILKTTARKIIDSAPVVLFDDASQEEVDVIKSRFNGVSRIGLKLDIRTEPAMNIPKISWGKRRPRIVPHGGDETEISDAPSAQGTAAAVREAASSLQSSTAATVGLDLYPEAPADDDDVYTYSVFLSNIGSSSRKEKAIEELMAIRDISHAEAAEMCERTVIPVVKGVSKAEAELTLKRFVKFRIFGCITKRPK